jgi:L,D-peptidoglycan transpeptidase YkuD (ErfK/YbiS/YcfS/YnhG family)
MNLTSWLSELAAAWPRHEMSKLQLFEYRQELETWMLDVDQWHELKKLAKQRHLLFPSISELQEIMHEVKRNTANGKNGARVWETFIGEDGLVYAKRSRGV